MNCHDLDSTVDRNFLSIDPALRGEDPPRLRTQLQETALTAQAIAKEAASEWA